MSFFSLWGDDELEELNNSSGKKISNMAIEEVVNTPDYKFKDTWKFREAAIAFKKNEFYTDFLENSRSFYEFWDNEENRILNGLTIDGVYITGFYYFFLNYCPIELVDKKIVKDARGQEVEYSERVTNFPKFWDLHWRLTMGIYIARMGISMGDYESLPIDLNLVKTEENLKGGKHFLFLAPRGVAKSYLQAAIAAYRYFFVKKAATFLVAGDKNYLTGDGVFTKFTSYITHINTHTPFKQFNDVKNDFNNMHIRASYRDGLGNEKGRKSEVIGVTIGDGKVNKLRGKRGYFLIEEIGSLACASELWKTIRPGTEQGTSVYGQLIGMGTGGDISGGAEFMEKAFYQPKAFNILKYENIYDNGLIGTECACFYPAVYNVDFIDEDGNTDKRKAFEYIQEKRKLAGLSKDSADLLGVKSEEPLTPSEALLRVDNTLFPKADLLQWKQEIIANNLHNYMVVNGFFVEKSNSIEFVPDPEAIPINKYPHDKRLPLGGCVSIFETPQYEGNKIPNNLYSVVVDPYMHEAGTSLGAIYVVKNINNFSKPDDCIVACYVGRPDSMEAFHKLCYYFSRYYNAKIGIENNAGQTLVTWFKTNRLLNHLAPEFELSFNEAIPKSSVRRGFGMHIDKRKKEIGLAYLAEWLTQKYYITEDGEQLYNYHKIYDLGLLDEFINFNPDGNFDRCLTAGQLILTENGYKSIESLKISEKVVTLTGNKNSIYMTHNNLYSGDLYKIQALGNTIPLELTSHHPVWTRSFSKKPFGRKYKTHKLTYLNPPEWKNAEALKQGDFIFSPKRINLEDSKIPADLLYVLGWYVSDGYASQNGVHFYLHITQIEIAKDLVEIINKYYKTSDSETAYFIDKNGRAVSSFKTIKTNQARIKNYKYDSPNMIRVSVFSKKFFAFCRKHGGNPSSKQLSSEVFNSKNLIPLLKGYFEGDGHYKSSIRADGYYRSHLEVASVFPILTYQIRQLLLEENIWCSLRVHKYAKKSNKHKDQFNLQISGTDCRKIVEGSKKFKQEFYEPKVIKSNILFEENGVWIPIKKLEKVHFNGNVYNISVENDETYIANSITTHNCSAMIIAMYYMKEVEYKYQQNFTTTNSSISAYFNANLYQ